MALPPSQEDNEKNQATSIRKKIRQEMRQEIRQEMRQEMRSDRGRWGDDGWAQMASVWLCRTG
jgi:hypothetical protein